VPKIPINAVGQQGINTDLPASELGLNVWSAGENVRCTAGYIEKVTGELSMFDGASIAPYFTAFVRNLSGHAYWIYAGVTAVWAWEVAGSAASTHNNITRAAGAYTASGTAGWQGGVLNGVPILNNGVDKPQMWLPIDESQLLVDLTNWPANTTAQIVRAYKNYLIALDVTKSGTRDPRLVKWSHPAAAGAVPSTWDETDATKDAGEYSLADTDGIIIDCLPMKDANIIYKDDSIWLMQAVNSSAIFTFAPLFRNQGVFGKNCAVEFQSGKHLVLGKDDVFVHDGLTMTSILEGRVKKNLYANMDKTFASNSFVTLDAENKEVWICYPTTGNTYPNRAILWNWVTSAIGYRDLPSVASIGKGALTKDTLVTDLWSSDTTVWSGDDVPWGSRPSNQALTQLLMASPTNTKLYGVFSDLVDFNGVAFTASVERTGLGIPLKTGQAPDITSMKFCSNIWPRITGTAGGKVQVRFGSQLALNSPVVWGDWKDFVIGKTKKIDVLASGVLFAIGFRSTDLTAWQLQGYDLDVKLLGVSL